MGDRGRATSCGKGHLIFLYSDEFLRELAKLSQQVLGIHYVGVQIHADMVQITVQMVQFGSVRFRSKKTVYNYM